MDRTAATRAGIFRCLPAGKSTHLISDEGLGKLFRQLDKIETERLENYVIPLAVRLQFEFAGRRGEIISLEWVWVDLENRRVVWPDSKTGGMSKPMSEKALATCCRHRAIRAAPDHGRALRPLEPCNLSGGCDACGTHGIRHR